MLNRAMIPENGMEILQKDIGSWEHNFGCIWTDNFSLIVDIRICGY